MMESSLEQLSEQDANHTSRYLSRSKAERFLPQLTFLVEKIKFLVILSQRQNKKNLEDAQGK